MLRKYYTLVTLAICLILCSCSLGPQPDKVVEVMVELETTTPAEMTAAKEAIKNRFEKLGAGIDIASLGTPNQLRLEISTHASKERVLNFINTQGKLEFYKVWGVEELNSWLLEVDKKLAVKDTLEEHPFLQRIIAQGYPDGGGAGYVASEDVPYVQQVLDQNEYKKLLGPLKKNTRFLWGVKDSMSGVVPFYALALENRKAAMSRPGILEAAVKYNYADQPVVNFTMDEKAAKQWEELTGWAYQSQALIAIVVDGVVRSAPGVSAGAIKGGRSEVSGNFTEEQAYDLAILLASGSVPKMKVLNYSVMPL